MSVKILRLINNEEVIGNIEMPSGKNEKYKVKNGAVVVPAGEGRLAMLPWLPHSKDTLVEIDQDRVVICFNPLDELANEYNSKIGSGLVVPPANFVPASQQPQLNITGD